ncbi:MAG: ABC transporter substrate-binding protein, partial [Saccharofermentanales bacterium]
MNLRIRIINVIMVAALFVSFLVNGCAMAPTGGSSAGAGSDSGSSAMLKKIRIGVMSDVGAVPFVIAQDQGFFEDRGLDIEITVFKSAMDRDTALQTGNLDGAMSDMLSVILFKKAGVDVRMTSDTYGNYKMITSPALDVAAFGALSTISVGLSSNTVIDLATSKIAQAKGFSDRLKKIAIPQMPVRLEMLRAGELDGATLPEPLASAAMLDGGELVASTEQLNLFPAIFIMTQAAIDENAGGIRLMYDAYNEAAVYLKDRNTAEIYDFLMEKLSFPLILKDEFELPAFSEIREPDEKSFAEISIWAKDMGLSD